MNIVSFLENIKNSDFLQKSPLIGCKSSEYPSLFFASLNRVIMNISASFEVIDLCNEDYNSIIARLEMSFLGMSTIYWLSNSQQMSDKEYKKIIAYLGTYQGPNTIIFFMPLELECKHPNVLLVDIPAVVDKTLFAKLLAYETLHATRDYTEFVHAIFTKIDTMSLNNAYALFRYAALVGNDHIIFTREWLDTLIVPEKSLFTLSSYFFAKEARQFFTAWRLIGPEYADAFWISFWSDQLWRAHNFVRLMQEKQLVHAKAIAHKLPFSFMQRDWKKVSLPELTRSHTILYEADYYLKNGSGSCALDLLYTTFLSK